MRRMLSLLMAVSVVGLVGCAHTRGDESASSGSVGLVERSFERPQVINGNYPNFPGNINFPFDSAHLTDEAIKIANEYVAELQKWHRDTAVIEGHTCDIGTMEYNLALGAKRALAVQSYVIRQGIDPARVSISSYGEESPAMPNDSEKNRKFNRRVVFKFTPGKYPELHSE